MKLTPGYQFGYKYNLWCKLVYQPLWLLLESHVPSRKVERCGTMTILIMWASLDISMFIFHNSRGVFEQIQSTHNFNRAFFIPSYIKIFIISDVFGIWRSENCVFD